MSSHFQDRLDLPVGASLCRRSFSFFSSVVVLSPPTSSSPPISYLILCEGFVISRKRIVTNAHVVVDHTFLLVSKHGSPTKYRAEVKVIGHECDLAILVVESDEFWEGMKFLELGHVPFMQEAVAVVGYPQGGDNISVKKEIVSRVEPTQYVHGATQLLAIQIDATINPGNS